MKTRVSLIVSTYNRPDALSLCLQSVLNQSVPPDEIVVGDDGSGPETREMIESFRQTSSVPVVHVWQEDTGFRLAMCRNKAVAACSYPYIIQIDGDLILHRRFVEDHLSFAREHAMLKGGRVRMGEKKTKEYDRLGPVCPGFFSKGLKKRMNCLRLPALSRYLATRYRKNKVSGLGCNMSFWKDDFIAVNGYDESFEGWGSEDDELTVRMLNAGIKRVVLKFSALTFHLWHPEQDMTNRSRNIEMFMESYRSGKIKADKGVSQYL